MKIAESMVEPQEGFAIPVHAKRDVRRFPQTGEGERNVQAPSLAESGY